MTGCDLSQPVNSAWNFLNMLGVEHFGSGHDLAGVPLRVVRKMHKESSDARGELLFADTARLVEVSIRKGADAPCCVCKARIKFREELVA